MVATRRGRPASLSRERVLDAAMALADRSGLDALTMRAVADDLGVEAMSLYHHLPGKARLLDGLVGELMAEIEAHVARVEAEAGPHGDWRLAVRRRCLAARDVMERHPWGPALMTSRSSVPPAVFAHFEAVLALMVEGGLSYSLGHRALHALGSMVLGFAQELFAPGAGEEGTTEEDVAQMADAFPQIAAMVAAELHADDVDPLGWCDSRAELEFTLDLLLDGLERQRLAAQG